MEKNITIGEKYGPAMEITDQAEADAYFEACVLDTMAEFHKSRAMAEAIVRDNLGYYAGYCSDETRARVERLFRCEHPIFGAIAGRGSPTPEEAIKMGRRAGMNPAAIENGRATIRKVTPGHALTFTEFSAANRKRCQSPKGFGHALDSWSLSDWFTAVLGELGEAANIAKKLNRVRDGIPGNTETETELREKLRCEIADVFIYLDLLAQSQGFALEDAVREAFDAKSEKIGYPARLGGVRREPLSTFDPELGTIDDETA